MAAATQERAERARRGLARWCGQVETAHELLEGVARRLRPLLDYDSAAWLATDPATVLFTDGFVEGFPPEFCAPWYYHELRVPDVTPFTELARARRPVTILSEAVAGELANSRRWRELLAPASLGHELRAAFRSGGACWGVATIHRRSTDGDFSRAEADLLASLAGVIGDGLRRTALRQQALADEPEGPGLLLVGPDRAVRPVTQAGARWLDVLGVPMNGARHTVLLTLGELVAGGAGRARRVRLRTRDGRWATLHAEAMSDERDTYAVIVEPSRPADIAAVAALAYGLSARESELVLALARGDSTVQLAERLYISPHTVRDHLKSIFDKTGVSSRNELVARLFHDHYTDRFFSQAVVS